MITPEANKTLKIIVYSIGLFVASLIGMGIGMEVYQWLAQ